MMILRVSMTLHEPPFDVFRSSYDTFIERAFAIFSRSARVIFITISYDLSIAD